MGYSTVSTSMFSPDMKQTLENVAKVLDIAGWTVEEAAEAIDRSSYFLACIVNGGEVRLTEDKWRELLDKAGRRSFDHDEDAA